MPQPKPFLSDRLTKSISVSSKRKANQIIYNCSSFELYNKMHPIINVMESVPSERTKIKKDIMDQ